MMKRRSMFLAGATFLLVGGMLPWARPAKAQLGGLGRVLDRAAKVADAQREWTGDEEKSVGEATAAKMIAVFGLFEQPQTQKYVTLVGRAVSQGAGRQNFEYHFGILDTEIVNAFAAPGGYIFVTRGLLANVQSEAELAGVLAHEVIHTSERHLEKELRNRKLASLAVEEGTQRIPQAELARLADRVSDALLTGKLSRDKEDEADSKGLQLVAGAGYDPRAFPEFLKWLGQGSANAENRRARGILLASHPKFDDRVKSLETIIGQRGWDKETWPRLGERYVASVLFTPAPAGSAPAPVVASAPPTAPSPAAAAPATATGLDLGQGGSGANWNFYSRPFSATQVMMDNKKKEQMRMKIYARENLFRMDMENKGDEMNMIMRFDRQVMWTVMPKQKSYLEVSLKLGNNFYEKMRDPKAKIEREDLGKERVGQYNTTKYRFRVTSEGETHTGLIWAADELNGFPVRMADEKNEVTIEFQDIQMTAPDMAVFEVPAGFQKVGAIGLGLAPATPAPTGETTTPPKQEERRPRLPFGLPRLPGR